MLPIVVVYFVLLPWFVLFFLDPEYTGFNLYLQVGSNLFTPPTHQLSDVWRWYLLADDMGGVFDSLVNIEASRRTGIGLTNLSLFGIIKLAYAIVPGAPQVFIALLNGVLILLSYLNLSRLMERWQVKNPNLLLLIVFLNPLMISMASGPTKEIWAVFFTTLFVLQAIQRRWLSLIIASIIAATFREVLLLEGAAFLVCFSMRIHAIWAWLALSALITAVDASNLFPAFTTLRLYTSEYLGQQSAPIMYMAGWLQGVPFGLFPATLIIFTINAINPAVGTGFFTGEASGFYPWATFISSLSFVAVLAVWALHVRRMIKLWQTEIAQVLLLLVLFWDVATVSQHRYLLPVWPYLLIGLGVPLAAAVSGQRFDRGLWTILRLVPSRKAPRPAV